MFPIVPASPLEYLDLTPSPLPTNPFQSPKTLMTTAQVSQQVRKSIFFFGFFAKKKITFEKAYSENTQLPLSNPLLHRSPTSTIAQAPPQVTQNMRNTPFSLPPKNKTPHSPQTKQRNIWCVYHRWRTFPTPLRVFPFHIHRYLWQVYN